MKALQPCYRGYTVYRGVVNRTVQADLSFQTWGLGSRFASVPIKVSRTAMFKAPFVKSMCRRMASRAEPL